MEAINGGHDDARKHAAMFLTLSFPFPAIIDAFDAAGGLRNVLNLLRHTATLGGGGEREREANAGHACHTLRQYCRAHLHRRIALELARESGGGGDGRRQSGGGGGPAHGPGHRAIDLGQAATDRNLHVASHNPKVATALQRHRWLVMDAFVAQEGPDVLLALVQAAPGDRHFHECVPAGLAVMRIATLYPAAKVATAGVALRAPGDDEHAESSTASSVLLEIASRAAAAQDSDAVLDALHIVCNLVSPPPALAASVHAAAAAVANDATTTPSKPSTKDGGTPTAGRRKSKGGALGGGGNKDAAAGGGLAAIEARMRPARAALREAGGIRASSRFSFAGRRRCRRRTTTRRGRCVAARCCRSRGTRPSRRRCRRFNSRGD